MTRADFDILPLTIQRKCFSTLERLRFAQAPDSHDNAQVAGTALYQRSTSLTPIGNPPSIPHGSDDLVPARRPRPGLASSPCRVGPGPAVWPQRQEPLPHRRHPSVLLDAADEAYFKVGKWQSTRRGPERQLPEHSAKPQSATTMLHSARNGLEGPSDSAHKTSGSLSDSFQWLEEKDDLDLRLFLDDYHFNLREEITNKSPSQRPSFCRHLSISKLPLGGRVSETFSRPTTKDGATPVAPGSPAVGVTGHVRRRSRALSLMIPNRQSLADVPTTVDPAATHYQDPDARMKLRVYLASPHKFDEAVEFGFPSIDEVQNQGRSSADKELSRPQTFLEDDASSMDSESSAADPKSPRTPEATEKAMPVGLVRVNQEAAGVPKTDHGQASACSREMTLRMTLTRPDLRSREDQMYGWQKGGVGRKSQAREEALTPLSPQSLSRKASIERQFADIDQEELANDNSVVRRFWNRMRRA